MDKVITDYQNIYYKYFKENIATIIVPFEKVRRKLLLKTILVTAVFLITGSLMATFMLYLFWINVVNYIFWTVMLFIMSLLLFRGLVYPMQMSKEFDKILINDFVKYMLVPFANFKPWAKNSNTETILNSQLFPNFDEQDDKQIIFGVYNSVNIILSKTFITKLYGAIQKNYLFKGVLIQLELGKSFNNHIIIQSKNEQKVNRYKNIHVNNSYSEFLNFYAKNQDCNLELLNDEIFTCIENIANAYSAMALKCSIKDDVVLIAITTKSNPFRGCSLFKSLRNVKNYDDFFSRFISIFKLVDEINSTMQP